MSQKNNLSIAVLVVLSVLVFAVAASATVWDPAAQWWWGGPKPADNPWHHGYFVGDGVTYAEMGTADFWFTQYGTLQLHNPSLPWLGKNSSDTVPYNDGATYVLPGWVAIAPGHTGWGSAFRWVSPVDGVVAVSAWFLGGRPVNDPSVWAYLDVIIRHNGVQIFKDTIDGFRNPLDGTDLGPNSETTYNGYINVSVGDTIDFIGLANPNRLEGAVAVGLSANITLIPEPTTAFGLLSLIGSAAFVIKRKK